MTIEIKKPHIKLPVNFKDFLTLNEHWHFSATSLPCKRYLMMVQNTPEGREFIKEFRQMNRKEYSIRIRGRHSNRKQAFYDVDRRYYPGTQNDVPVALAERFAVYADSKVKESVMNQYWAEYRASRITYDMLPKPADFKLVS